MNTRSGRTALPTSYSDDFRDLSRIHVYRNLIQRKAFSRIVTRPDVRINPIDPTHYKYEGRVCGYGYFPYILRLQNGTLLCFYSERSSHIYCPGGRAVVSRSTDGGRSWTEPQAVFHLESYVSGIGGVCQTSDGLIWLKIRSQYYDGSKGAVNDPRAWKTIDTLMRSRDEGETWEKSASGPKLPAPAIQMSNSQLLWIGTATDERGELIRASFLHDDVDGRLEWKTRKHPELGPTPDEWSVVETRKPGVLVCMMRQQQHSQFYCTAMSRNYGKTWTLWRESNVYMGPNPTRPMLRRMADGTLLFTYGQRWIGRTFVVASHDDGETWDVAHRQTILHSPTAYHWRWDSHYTDIAHAEGNVWIAVDYIISPRHAEQRGVYGTFIDERYFRDVFRGITLAPTSTAVTAETLGHWSFDELEGDIAYCSVGSNFGEIHGARRVAGRIGQALKFDGKDDYVMVYDDASLWVPRYFTVEAWIRTRDADRDQTIASKAPKYTLSLHAGKPALEIGQATMVAEMDKPLPNDRWVHVAATFGMRHSYSRATFFVDGKENSWVSPSYPEYPKSFVEAIAQSDTRIVGGPMFQEYHCKNTSNDNLVIGMDNNLESRPFDGLIDEVVIHSRDLLPDRVHQSSVRGYRRTGTLASLPIVLPEGARWLEFAARSTTPRGTKVVFRVLDPVGKVLKANVTNGTDISDIRAEQIVLHADLATTSLGQTPILHQWSVTCEGGVPTVLSRPFPNQTAAKSAKVKIDRSSVTF